ncbi:MAG: DUF1071 domain-containing protein [Clostridia bacterium]|nr:DUF1071 domain-containing protein [Clostridia bacterium]
MPEKSIFETLSEQDMTANHKKKNNITYLPWSAAWAAVKRRYPKATYEVNKDENQNLYHTDGKTCWVEVTVHIEDESQTETLAVMDHRNAAISAENVTSTQVNNSIKRCMVKCLALFGLDLNLWEGEELSAAAKEAKAKEDEAQKILAKAKKDIVEKCKTLISSGKDKDEIYAIIEEVSGDKNPNAIKDLETADSVLDALEGVKA